LLELLPGKSAGNRAFYRLARLMLIGLPAGMALFWRVDMKKFEAIAGSAVWMAVALLMAAAALEPVEVQAQTPPAVAAAVATCADGSAQLAMGCESIHL
jgi:hypothetical protein